MIYGVKSANQLKLDFMSELFCTAVMLGIEKYKYNSPGGRESEKFVRYIYTYIYTHIVEVSFPKFWPR